jgi:hypothetical protein
MERYPVQLITAKDGDDGEIVVKVVTFDGKNIEGFPIEVRGKRVEMGGFEIL